MCPLGGGSFKIVNFVNPIWRSFIIDIPKYVNFCALVECPNLYAFVGQHQSIQWGTMCCFFRKFMMFSRFAKCRKTKRLNYFAEKKVSLPWRLLLFDFRGHHWT